MMKLRLLFTFLIVTMLPLAARAAIIEATVLGSDAIFLAGRTDLVIPAAGVFWPGGLTRHPITPEMIQETLPPAIAVTSGDVVRALDPAIGGVSFFNGFGAPFFGPSGNGPAGSSLTPFGGISGYLGPQGPLTGVFLDDALPSIGPPSTINFSPTGIGIDFASLTPQLGQIFYIGDGVNSAGDFQTFIAPAGATRLFLGIPDGFGFGGAPGAYDDNDGSYRVRIGVNQFPDQNAIPEPSTIAIWSLLGLVGLGFGWRKKRKAA